MWTAVGKAQITAQDIRIAGVPPFMELRLDADEIILTDSSDGRLWIRSATGHIVVTEAAINSAVAGVSIDRVRSLDLKTYNGFIRVTGRYSVVGGLSVGFSITAAPEIESGSRLRLAVRDCNVAGALPMPPFVVNMIASAVNEQLGKTFDTNRLPVPIRLTTVKIDPGRLTLSGSLDMPPESAPPEPGSPRPAEPRAIES
jgi:hypothetical protein